MPGELIDLAQEREQQHRDDAIAAQKRRHRTLKPAGACHYCGELVGANDLFCNIDCRNDYDDEEETRRKQGLSK